METGQKYLSTDEGSDDLKHLYRRAMLNARRESALGTIQLTRPKIGWAFFAAGVAASTALILLLVLGHYTPYERIAGTLVADNGVLDVTPNANGTVARVLVRNGETVRAQQPLIYISSEKVSVSLGNTYSSVARDLDLKREQLKTELVNQSTVASITKKNALKRATLLKDQIRESDDQLILQKQLVDNAQRLYERWEKEETSGTVSNIELYRQHESLLQSQLAYKQLKARRMQLEQDLLLVQQELDELPAKSASQSREINGQIADVSQALSQNAAESATVVRSPVDGIVTNLLVHPGQTVSAQQSTLTIVPNNSQMLAEFWVPSRFIGTIHHGARVVLRYRSFPYQQYGQYFGQVGDISTSAIWLSNAKELTGSDATGPMYRIRVTLDRQSVSLVGRAFSLLPGMTVDADVILEKQRLLQWLLQPVYEYSLQHSNSSSPQIHS